MARRLGQHGKALQGLAYLLALALGMAFCVAAYDKSLPWQRSVNVMLTTASAGLEMDPQADVMLQGITVGQVRQITASGSDTTLHIALDPAQVHLIPANVDAQILPKTLFGAKYVNLLLPARPSSDRIGAGDVITQSTTSVEIDQLFTHLVPVLAALNPQQLSVTLGAAAQALQGRGTELGQTLSLLHTYFTGLDPHLPALTQDLHQLAAVANTYAANAPALLRVLGNTTAISAGLLVPQEQSLAAFLQQTITTADEANGVLADNADRIVTLTGAAKSIEQVLADYSSEFPCLITALNIDNAVADHVFGGEGPYVKASVDLVTQRPAYTYPADSPQNPRSDANNDVLPVGVPSWAPHCAVIPTQVRGIQDIPPYSQQSQAPVAPATTSGAAVPDPAQALAALIAGQAMKVAPGQTPGVAGLLLQPLLSPAGVSVP
jgi:phospholipid/cholesterol/gamma-HCH transport system substrate-binding protein